MSRPLLAAVLPLFLPTAALAEVPAVVTDILPVQGLVARVMQGLGEPAVLIPPGASPHGYALRPSDARALSQARVVFMVGLALTPWLTRPVETLAPEARHVTLLDAPGTELLPTREGATFEPHSHEGEDHEGEGHDHDHDHDHEGGHDHAEEGHGHPAGDNAAPHDDHDHDHEHGSDPHAWLDPDNGKAWLTSIAATLADADPEHAAEYRANAAAGASEIDAAATDAARTVAGLGDLRFIVFHDAYQYFEHHFGIAAAGSVSLSDASAPSPARIAALRAKVASIGATCALSEPQFNADLLKVVFEGTEARTAILDPLGTTIPEGPAFYPALLRQVATQLQTCR